MIDLAKRPPTPSAAPVKQLRTQLRAALDYVDALEFYRDYRVRRADCPVMIAWAEDHAEDLYYQLPQWLRDLVPPVKPEDTACEFSVPSCSI